jgi:hypothetical protein
MTFKLFLNEDAPLKPSHDYQKKMQNLNPGEVCESIANWFSGALMGRGNDSMASRVERSLKSMAKYYKTPASGKVYRATHIQVLPEYTEKDIQTKIKKVVTGLKPIQSWSRNQSNAEYFYDHYVVGVNHLNRPLPGRAWVIYSTSISELDYICAWEDCIQFLSDLFAYIDDRGPIDYDGQTIDTEALEHAIDVWNDDTMRKNGEIICITPKVVPGAVVDVKYYADY